MRRRYVLALVLAAALIFALAGTVFGHYVVPRSKSDSASCILFHSMLEQHGVLTANAGGSLSDAAHATVEYYNEHCR
jgi:hypothetical protein